MKYIGGLLVLGYTALNVLGLARFPDDDRGKLPPNVRTAPGGLLMWHTGFMGGK